MTCAKCKTEQRNRLRKFSKDFVHIVSGGVLTVVGVGSIAGGVFLWAYGITNEVSEFISPLAMTCIVSGIYSLWLAGSMYEKAAGEKK